MIDSHCHLEFKDFDDDRKEVIEKSRGRIEAIVDSCADIEKCKDVLQLHRSNPNFVFPCLGLHPEDALEATEKEIESYKRTIKEHSGEVVAIGEVGLDYNSVKGEKRRQESKEIFLDFVRLSNELDLPVVVHSRRAVRESLKILKKKEGDVIFHCFSGSVDDLYEALDRGYYISLGGIIFRSPKKYERIIEDLPLENLLLETDAPFLAKNKEDRSEPWFIWKVAERIAEIKGGNFRDVWVAAGNNAKEVFDLPIDI